ncbi:MAG: hypothetical protein HQK52_22980 [Oligoflexia bacterium]|nr:hypothetical protein [Oligoflexia bacterium]
MRIISKFSDYYDSVQSFDKDDILYIRKSKYFNIDNVIRSTPYYLASDNKVSPPTALIFKGMVIIGYRNMLLGFCGKLYPLIEIHYQEKANGKVSPAIKKVHFYQQAELYSFFLEMEIKIPKRGSGIVNQDITPDYFQQREKVIEKSRVLILELFQTLKTPSFIIRKDPDTPEWSEKYCRHETIIVTNPGLQEISFQKVLDPFTTFQEISMYLGGVLGSAERSTLAISDEVKAQQHGFDRYSFKTMKGDKKPRKRNRGKLNE